jgi:hypothetical protein
VSKLTVIVDPNADPITGTVSDGAGSTARFVGYAHLVAEIERHRCAGIATTPVPRENAVVEHRGRTAGPARGPGT